MNLLRGYGKQPGSKPRALREFNDCNLPKGQSDGGRFGANDDPRCKTPAGQMHGPERPGLGKRVGMADAAVADNRRAYYATSDREKEERLNAQHTVLLQQQRDLEDQQSRKRAARDESKDTLKQVTYDQEMAALRAEGVEAPELTSQDTKKSSTKKQRFEAGDNVDDVSGDTGNSIFGGLTGEEVAREMTKYIDETMDVSISASLSGGDYGGQEVGPDPDDRDVRREFERHQESQMEDASSKHYEETTEEFKQYGTKAFAGTGLTMMKVMERHAQHFIDNPDALPPPAVDPKQLAFDVDDDPTNTDFERTERELTPAKVIEILDKHQVFNKVPGETGRGMDPERGIAERIESELEDGTYEKLYSIGDVMAAMFDDPSSEHYNNPGVVAAREELLTYRPMEMVSQAVADKTNNENNAAWVDLIDEGAREAFAGTTWMSAITGTESDQNSAASDWYSENDKSDDIDYDDIDSFESWYSDQYGHDPSEWQDRMDNYDPDGGGDGEGEVSIEFTGREGSSITRTFRRDGGELSVYHAYFKNKGSAGQGKDLMRGQMELYERMGVDHMTTTANISTGSYAWARYGFTAESPYELASAVRRRLSRVMDAAPGLAAMESQLSGVIDEYEQDEFLPWKVADMRVEGDPREIKAIAKRFMTNDTQIADISSVDDPRRWDADIMKDAENGVLNLGKILMVGHSWSARFDMTSDTHRSRMRDYIGDWTRPADQEVERGPSREQLQQARAGVSAMAGKGEGKAITDRVTKQTKAAQKAAGGDDWMPNLSTAKTSRATALRDGRVPREDYGNTADEVRQTERTLKNAPNGARVSRTLADGSGMVYGQVTNRGDHRVITPDDPEEIYQYHNRQFHGGWSQSPETGPTARRGKPVTNMMTTPAGTRVKADTPRGRLYGRIQGRPGQRGVTLRDSPSETMAKLLSAGNRGVQWRKK